MTRAPAALVVLAVCVLLEALPFLLLTPVYLWFHRELPGVLLMLAIGAVHAYGALAAASVILGLPGAFERTVAYANIFVVMVGLGGAFGAAAGLWGLASGSGTALSGCLWALVAPLGLVGHRAMLWVLRRDDVRDAYGVLRHEA